MISENNELSDEDAFAVMHAGFFGRGGPPNVLGSDFSRVERNFTTGQSHKIRGNFQKYALKLINI